MTDKEILDKYIDLDKSCLTESEKKEVRDMIYKYKEAFGVDFSYCWLNLEEQLYSLEQYIGCI